MSVGGNGLGMFGIVFVGILLIVALLVIVLFIGILFTRGSKSVCERRNVHGKLSTVDKHLEH